MTVPVLLLLAGFVLLLKGADLFVAGMARLARGLGVPCMAVGLTVAAFGSSVPGLFVNIAAAVDGSTDIALGNVVGSTTANILLVLGLSALTRPLTISKGLVWQAIPFSLLAAVMMWVLASDVYLAGTFFSAISRSDGLVLLGFFVVFLAYTASVFTPVDGLPPVAPTARGNMALTVLKMIVGFYGLVLGGRWIIANTASLADALAVPRAVGGLTLVALGTSLPGLATAVTASWRGEAEIAVGSVVGATTFNVFFILGVSAAIRPLPFNPAFNVDMGVMTAAGILLFIFLFFGRAPFMGRLEGALALVIYALYLGYLLYPLCIGSLLAGTAG